MNSLGKEINTATLFERLGATEGVRQLVDGVIDAHMLNPEIKARFRALTLAATGDGMTDAGVLHLCEVVRRPSEFLWQWWDDRQMANIAGAMDVLEGAADELKSDGPITIAEITVGAGLGWMDLRFPDMGWRDSRPKLGKWYDAIAKRPSFVASAPPKP